LISVALLNFLMRNALLSKVSHPKVVLKSCVTIP
jgi:hypothetical protein